MLRMLLAAFALMAFGTAPQAATINATLSGPTSVVLGESATFTLTYDASSAPSGWGWDYTTGSGSMRIDGNPVTSFTPSSTGGMVSFTTVFTSIGNYLVSAVASLNFYDVRSVYVGHGTYFYDCGNVFNPRTCVGTYPIYQNQNVFVGNNSLSESLQVQVVAPVPLPATGLVLIGALGGLAMLRRRRRA